MKEMTVSLKEYLTKGLRTTDKQPSNTASLVQAQGCVVEDQALASLEFESELDLSSLAASFPYPQIFDFDMVTLVCTSTEIHELVGSGLTSKLSGLPAGLRWSAADFGTYILLTNGKVTVERNTEDFTYAVSDKPIGTGLCANNGQIFICGCEVPKENIDAVGVRIEDAIVEVQVEIEGHRALGWGVVEAESESGGTYGT